MHNSFWLGSAFALGLLAVAGALFLAALSRHKKSGSAPLVLMGAVAQVHEALNPVGSVLVNGELWQARAVADRLLSKGSRVRVVSAACHYLIVEAESGLGEGKKLSHKQA